MGGCTRGAGGSAERGASSLRGDVRSGPGPSCRSPLGGCREEAGRRPIRGGSAPFPPPAAQLEPAQRHSAAGELSILSLCQRLFSPAGLWGQTDRPSRQAFSPSPKPKGPLPVLCGRPSMECLSGKGCGDLLLVFMRMSIPRGERPALCPSGEPEPRWAEPRRAEPCWESSCCSPTQPAKTGASLALLQEVSRALTCSLVGILEGSSITLLLLQLPTAPGSQEARVPSPLLDGQTTSPVSQGAARY